MCIFVKQFDISLMLNSRHRIAWRLESPLICPIIERIASHPAQTVTFMSAEKYVNELAS